MSLSSRLPRYRPYVLALLRISAAVMFLQHGTAKLFGFPHVAMFDGLQLVSLLGIGGLLELAGGALLVVGWKTRPVAFLLSGEMAVAYFWFHAGSALWAILNKGELS
ncbi:MAG: DoxX family protein, partial [Methylocystis sp.]